MYREREGGREGEGATSCRILGNCSSSSIQIITLVTLPLSLFRHVTLVCISIFCIIIFTWIQLVRNTINFHVNVCWRIMIWTIALISLPLRVLTALKRERLLETYLHEMQIEFENIIWYEEDLKEQFQAAIKDCRVMESILAELEEEHDLAIAKMELLEGELQELKDENLRLYEIQKKAYWDFKAQDDSHGSQKVRNVDDPGTPVVTEKPDYNRSTLVLEDLLMQRESRDDEGKGKILLSDIQKNGSKAIEPVFPHSPGIILEDLVADESLDLHRRVALSQSLFSAVLSLLVGMIIWEAEDPCMPLVVALFTVVGMSLKSVVQFFSTIKNKPASDAVTLLSFNWFILGTLTYPTLPRIAYMLAPLALRVAKRTVIWLGISLS